MGPTEHWAHVGWPEESNREGDIRSHPGTPQKWWKCWDSGIPGLYLGTLSLTLLIQRTGFPQTAQNPTVHFHTNSHTQRHRRTQPHTSLLSAIPLKYTVGTFLITAVPPGVAHEPRWLLFKTDKGRRRKQDPVIPGACLLFLAGISFHNGSGPKNVTHCAPLRLLGLMLAARAVWRKKEGGEGGMGDRRASLIRTKAQRTPEAHRGGRQEELDSSNMKREWGGELRELPFLVVWSGHNGIVVTRQKLIKTINKPQPL